jgi:hypothetical protein
MLEIPLPRVLSSRSALTDDDAALCEQLAVDLTFDRTSSLGPPPLDKVALDPKPGATCTWVLGRTAQLLAGTYDLVVRFTTKTAVMSCPAPIVVGAYVKRGLSFPFPADFMGLTDADFIYRPGQESLLGDPSVKFDIAGDGRDSLSKLAQGADPCHAASRPVPALLLSNSSVTETSTVMIDLSSVDADDVPHVVTLRIKQPNGPSVGTELLVFQSYTDERGGGVLTRPMALERWSLRAGPDSDSKKGAGHWQIAFVPADPFVGQLSLWAVDDDGQGNVLSRTATLALQVANVREPTELLSPSDGSYLTVLRFQEAGGPPTSHDFTFRNRDLGADYSTWTPTIASGPAGLVLSRDAGLWKLSFSPSNDQALEMPAGGYPLQLVFRDPNGASVGTASVAVEVYPLYNNPPLLVPPSIGDLDLPAPPYAEHRIPFQVIDPDQVDAAPTCTTTLTAAAGCSAPFSSIRCEPSGNRSGANWPFVVILTPGAGYAACGSSPSFTLGLSITDTPPAGAINGPQSTGTGAMPLQLRTASVVAAGVVMGGPGFVAGDTSPSPPLLCGRAKKAIIQVQDAAANPAVTLVDLTAPAPSFAYRFAPAAFCGLDENKRPREIAAADETNGRLVVISRGYDAPSASCQNNGLNVVTLAGPATTFHSGMEICNSVFNDIEGNPTVDAAGNFYVPCLSTPPQVARIAPNGTVTTRTIATYVGNDSDRNRRSALVTDPRGKAWLVWPDSTGLVLVDLSTFDQATPTASLIPMDAAWSTNALDDAAADPWRPEYLVAYNRSGQTAQLLRVRFPGGAPVLDPPLDLGAIGGNTNDTYSYMRLVFRVADTSSVAPAGTADLVVAGGSSNDDVPHVDLAGWRVSAVRPNADYYLGNSGGIFPSPDRRYYVAPTTMNYETGDRGLYLYRFDPTVARQFVSMPVPNGGTDWAARTESSRSGDLMVISESDNGSGISVIYFVEAAAGRD